MNRWPRVLVGVLACWPVRAAAEPAPVHAPPSELGAASSESADESSVEALLHQGIALRKVGDDRAARAAFAKAWELGRSPEALAQLALAEQALGHWVEAHEHMLGALQRAEDAWIQEHRVTLEAALREAESRLGTVEISCDVEGAEVKVDGRTLGKSPFAAPLFFSVGRSVVQVSAPGYFDVTREVQVDAGALSRLDVALTPRPPAVTLPAEPHSSASSTRQATGPSSSGVLRRTGAAGVEPRRNGDSSARDAVLYGSLGFAALGFSVGVSGYVLREINVRHYNDNARCATETGATRSEECASEAAAWRLGEALAIGGFSVGGVFAALGLYLWLDEPEAQDPGLACSVGVAFIGCHTRF